MAHTRRSLVVLAAALLLILAQPARAQSKVYEIADYNVTLTVREDGSYGVVEEITFDFQQGTFTFATRDIPLRLIDSITDVEVGSTDVALRDVSQSVRGGEQHIRWTFPERTGPTTFTLRYTAHGALFASDDANVIDWDAVGTGWSVPIHDVDVRVVLPEAFDLTRNEIDIQPQTEGELTQTDAAWVAEFHHARLAPGTAYRVIVTIPQQLPGRTLASRSQGAAVPWERIAAAVAAVVVGLLPGLTAFARWRGPRYEATTVEEPDIALPRAAVLLHGASTSGQRAFPAVIFDLAARGHLTLRRVTQKTWIFDQKKVRVVYHVDPADLTEFEQRVVDEMHEYDTLEAFGRRAGSFRSHSLQEIRQDLIDEGYLRSNLSRSYSLVAAGVILDLTAVLLAVLVGGWLWTVVGLLFGLGIGVLFASARAYTPTEEGARLKAQIKAYIDQTRDDIGQLRQYDPTAAARRFIAELPWLALDSDVDERWVDKLADSLKEAREDLEVPPWAEDMTDEAIPTANQAYAAFMPYYHVTAATAAAVAPSSGAAGASAAGAGAGGGAGGGGGGAG